MLSISTDMTSTCLKWQSLQLVRSVKCIYGVLWHMAQLAHANSLQKVRTKWKDWHWPKRHFSRLSHRKTPYSTLGFLLPIVAVQGRLGIAGHFGDSTFFLNGLIINSNTPYIGQCGEQTLRKLLGCASLTLVMLGNNESSAEKLHKFPCYLKRWLITSRIMTQDIGCVIQWL